MMVWSLRTALGGGLYCSPVPLPERRSWCPELVGDRFRRGPLESPLVVRLRLVWLLLWFFLVTMVVEKMRRSYAWPAGVKPPSHSPVTRRPPMNPRSRRPSLDRGNEGSYCCCCSRDRAAGRMLVVNGRTAPWMAVARCLGAMPWGYHMGAAIRRNRGMRRCSACLPSCWRSAMMVLIGSNKMGLMRILHLMVGLDRDGAVRTCSSRTHIMGV